MGRKETGPASSNSWCAGDPCWLRAPPPGRREGKASLWASRRGWSVALRTRMSHCTIVTVRVSGTRDCAWAPPGEGRKATSAKATKFRPSCEESGCLGRKGEVLSPAYLLPSVTRHCWHQGKINQSGVQGESGGFGIRCPWVKNPDALVTTCMTSGKWLNLCEPNFLTYKGVMTPMSQGYCESA